MNAEEAKEKSLKYAESKDEKEIKEIESLIRQAVDTGKFKATYWSYGSSEDVLEYFKKLGYGIRPFRDSCGEVYYTFSW